jgi:hypothetical protein
MGAKRNAYHVFVGKPEGRRPLGTLKHRWEFNIELDGREAGVVLTHPAQKGEKYRAVVNTVMNIRASESAGNSDSVV